jgi:hypothetical protein
MGGFVATSELFDSCVARRQAMGLSRAEAERLCRSQEPSDLVLYRPPFVTPSVASEQTREGAQKPSESTSDEQGDTDPLGESAAFMGPSRDRSRSTGRDLTPGTVPAWRDGRTEAHVWAKEMVRVGQRPPFNREGWVEHATRMGLHPDGIREGWDYIERVFSKKYESRYDHVVASLKQVLGEGDPYSGGPPPYGGYYASFGHSLKVRMRGSDSGPGFPFHTKAAEKVYQAARKIIAKDRYIDAEGAYRQALGQTGVNVFEMTPEDDALMGIALHWELSGKDAFPEPPKIPTQRATGDMKGTQIGFGRELAPMGAP